MLRPGFVARVQFLDMKTIFITGGASGIGEAAVRRFHVAGWGVAFADIDFDAGVALAAELDGTQFFAVDTRDKIALQRAVDAAVAHFGHLDSVFANAGIHRKNTILDIDDAELRLVVDTNLYGTIYTLQACLPHIIAAGGGTAVLMASDQATIGKRASFAYGLTKGAIAQMTKSMALDLAPHCVRVNAVCPGTIHTRLVDSLFERLSAKTGRPVAEYFAEEDAEFPLGRIGTPAEVADAVYFLASDASSFTTGSLLPVDGGLTAG